MERVLGIGGFFFRARDPKKLEQWYNDRFGISPVTTSAEETPWTQQAGNAPLRKCDEQRSKSTDQNQ